MIFRFVFLSMIAILGSLGMEREMDTLESTPGATPPVNNQMEGGHARDEASGDSCNLTRVQAIQLIANMIGRNRQKHSSDFQKIIKNLNAQLNETQSDWAQMLKLSYVDLENLEKQRIDLPADAQHCLLRARATRAALLRANTH